MPECAAFVRGRPAWAVRSPSLFYSQGFLMLLLIDNYDSFTWNLVQYFGALGQEVVVRRNDELSLEEIARLAPRHLPYTHPLQSSRHNPPLPRLPHSSQRNSLHLLGIAIQPIKRQSVKSDNGHIADRKSVV